MKVTKTALDGVVIIEPDVFGDSRGFFMETWNKRRYEEAGIRETFVQDNISYSGRGVVRALHFQNPGAQGKLVFTLKGEVWDVAVDVRAGSPTFLKWVGVALSADNKRQLYIPPGFAHGFAVTGDDALFVYKCTEFYDPKAERSIIWNDPQIGVEWPVKEPILSGRDGQAPMLKDLDKSLLPVF
ncbi:MAG: dTDP-4-dehydrorhamnose 3,5-epimerase [Nitrospinae bacterium]|nr:dTDP-4-dehydrorhamnose 3,5-epimerase [Nitrospinota bacterium]